jgi:ribosomal-protein-alanine N-acetyltransferase
MVAVDELGPELDRTSCSRVAYREHAPADAIPRLQQERGDAARREFRGSRETRRAGPNDDDVRFHKPYMTVKTPVLRTKRLELRPPRIDDARALFDAYATDPEVTRYLPWDPATSVAETAAHVASRLAAMAAGEAHAWTIRMLDEQNPVGMIELRVSATEGNVGYVLARSHWGRGLMPEALASIVEFVRSDLRLNRVWGICDVENFASARVFEKCGFRYVGIRPGCVVHPAVSETPRDARMYETLLS